MRKTRTSLVVGVAAAAMSCALIPFMSVTPAVAGLTGDDGLIAIGTDRGIEVFDPDGDGSDRRVLIPSDGPFLMPSYPTWSPRGDKIAYVQSANLWVADADGSNPAMISEGEAVWDPVWSPDGRIAYSTGRSGELMIRDADGSHPQRFQLDGPLTTPGWTPDGRLLTFATDPDYPFAQPFIADGDGTRWREITDLNGTLLEGQESQTQITASSSGLLGWVFYNDEGDGPFVGIVGFDGIRHLQRPSRTLHRAFDLAFSPTGDRVTTLFHPWDADPLNPDAETLVDIWDLDFDGDDLIGGGWEFEVAGSVRGVDWQPKCTIVASPAAEAGFGPVTGTLGDDLICAGDGDTVIYGGGGNDVIYAGAGRDTVYGGTGNDVIVGGYGNDNLRGGDGNDLINSRNDRRVPDTINGGPDRNTCIANRRDILTSC